MVNESGAFIPGLYAVGETRPPSTWSRHPQGRAAGEGEAPGTRAYYERVRELGLTKAFKERDAAFGDGIARVREPEIRDADGRLIDP